MHKESHTAIIQDIGAERAVLAGLLQYGRSALYDICDIISENTFTIQENKVLFTCIEYILKESEKADITSIFAVANNLGVYNQIFQNKQDIEFLSALFNFSIHLENVRQFAKKIAKLEYARIAQSKHREAFTKLNGVSGNETIDGILAISEDAIFDIIKEINKGRDDYPVAIGESAVEFVKHLAENPVEMVGIPTPFKYYNTAIGGGLRAGGVNLIAARPKKGKSTLAKQISLHTSINLDIPTLYLDTEMVREEQLCRALSSLSEVELDDIETGKFAQNQMKYQKVLTTAEQLQSNTKFLHKVVAGKPFEEILSIIRRWILKDVGRDDIGNVKPCLVIYDYFKLMDASQLDKMAEHQAMGFQISRLSDFSKEYGFACLALVQLNREGADKDTAEVISQSDRLLWLCHSLSIYRHKTVEETLEDGVNNGNTRLKVIETRHGSGLDDGDYINLQFSKKINKIIELGTKRTIKNTNTNGGQIKFEVQDDNNSTEEIPFE